MYVIATEFKANFGKYLDLITKEDIFITKNGKAIAKLVNPTTRISRTVPMILPMILKLLLTIIII
jgi:antitoxin (DNA-binding transcriptional repressor) of toxin-antitoxin stability system